MEADNLDDLKKRIIADVEAVIKLNVRVWPGGGYTMGYNKSNLPPYAVGLFGALALINGEGIRRNLGLTYEETIALECGFNITESKYSKKYPRLTQVGAEIMTLVVEMKQPRLKTVQKIRHINEEVEVDEPETAPDLWGDFAAAVVPRRNRRLFGTSPSLVERIVANPVMSFEMLNIDIAPVPIQNQEPHPPAFDDDYTGIASDEPGEEQPQVAEQDAQPDIPPWHPPHDPEPDVREED